jgi:hypothetical protein
MMANAEEYPLFSSQMVTDHRGNTFRSVYKVRFTDRGFVLHAFQKKAKSGIATPKSEIALLRRWLKHGVEISSRCRPWSGAAWPGSRSRRGSISSSAG